LTLNINLSILLMSKIFDGFFLMINRLFVKLYKYKFINSPIEKNQTIIFKKLKASIQRLLTNEISALIFELQLAKTDLSNKH